MLSFIGIGAQKAGTTWLFEQLRKHPAVHFPAGKEIHFWDAQYHKGIAWYEGIFLSSSLVEGEITPAYAIQPKEIVDTVRRSFPELRLIYVLRNPIERAWSSALMALGRAELEYPEASDQWFLDHFNSQGSLRRGDYEACIRTWRSIFPPEQLQILFYDDLVASPRDFIKRCALHIGVDEKFFDNVPEGDLRAKVFVGPRIGCRTALCVALRDLYRDKILSLEAYLGRSLAHWLR